MGYATTRADLGNGHEISELKTGDIAERTNCGFFRLVGRKSRFIKPNGLRVNLDDVEAYLRKIGIAAYCSGTDDLLAVFVVGGGHKAALASDLAKKFNLSTTSGEN